MWKSKKLWLVVGLLLLSALLFIHGRTPFFLVKGGPWSVGFGFSDKPIPEVKPRSAALFTPEKLRETHPNSMFLADPFFIKEKDSFYLFFEHRHFEPFKADLSVLVSADGKNYSYKGNVLTEKFHLSYPQVFKKDGRFYMVPETAAAGKILLYSTTRFPFGWKIQDTLVNGSFKDPSIFLSDTLNMMVASDSHLTLHLFTADSLSGKWKQGKKILMGSEARAGGRIFEAGGQLYLPVQDCARGYGSSLSLFRFQFKEKEISLVKVQDEYLKAHPEIPELAFGMHHIDIQRVDDRYYYVYDGNRIKSSAKKQSVYGAFKLTVMDILNWL